MKTIGILAAGLALHLAAAAAMAQVPALKPTQVASGLTLPTFVTGAPGDTTHLYILEHGTGSSASIKVLNMQTNQISTFLTINGVATGDEQGLLGLAFDPAYQTNGLFYVNYVAQGGTAGLTRVQSYTATSPTTANPSAVATLLQFDQPQANHNGGWIGFSNRPNETRSLYISTGDGGGDDDNDAGHVAGGNAQSNTTLLGKMLRINVNANGGGYTIPTNNPFFGVAGARGEIFAYGLRNPYRASFDRATGNLYIGDVGQTAREEVDVQLATNQNGGENYGWRLREGTISTPTGGSGGAIPPGGDEPILDYPRSGATIAGRTVIGGYVYNGQLIPDLQGTYIFGDYLGVSGGRTSIFALDYNGTTVSNLQNITSMLNPGATPLISNISSFGEDTAGELYIVDISGGRVFRIDPVVPIPEPASLMIGVVGAGLLMMRRRRVHR